MKEIRLRNRIADSVRAENEWIYLVNETLAGEKTIVPLLKAILDNEICVGPLREAVERQLAEEIGHVRLYHNLAGSYRIDRNNFRTEFSAFVNALPSVTQKLFALQGMLEGIALGALYYRLEMIEDSPSLKTDQLALADEMSHTQLAFPHFRHLIDTEGRQSQDLFRATAKAANEVFANNFNGTQMANVLTDLFNEPNANSQQIEKSTGMATFRRYSKIQIVKTRSEFLKQYFLVAG
jgi:hypothetical protein